LWQLPVGVSSPTPERLAGIGEENALYPSVSRDGRRIVYQREANDTNVWRISRTAPHQRESQPQALIASTQADGAPRFSPDGGRIAFISERSGQSEIWIANSDGRNPVQLTSFSGLAVGSPRWAPDGRRIAFDCVKDGHADIYVISAEGGAPTRVTTEPGNDVRPSWSGDGLWIYFGSNRSGDWQIWKAPAAGGPAVQVTQTGGREAYERPDGRFLYYTKLGVPGIWKTPVDGGEEVRVLQDGWQGRWKVTRRDLWSLNLVPTPVVRRFDLDTGRLTEAITLPKDTRITTSGTAIDISPDGQWILYVNTDQIESDILMVENFR
jgi:Tol biopolymer transport system component